MKKSMAILVLFCGLMLSGNAQTETTLPGKTNNDIPYIEVIGTSEMEVVPDMLHISIVLKDNHKDKENSSIEQQEELLKKALTDCGVPILNLKIDQAKSNYAKVSWISKAAVTQKVYSLVVPDAATMTKVFAAFQKSEVIDNYYLAKVTHSKLDSLKQEVQVSAIKQAKKQAGYMLEAIGEKLGKPLEIREVDENGCNLYINTQNPRIVMDQTVSGSALSSSELGVQNIKIQKFIYIKFAIQ
jgi:uncharacterized protein YggE